MATREEMITEAIERMKVLHLHPNVIHDFKCGTVNVSVDNTGILMWANKEEQEMIRNCEETFGCVVYHAITCDTNFGRLFNMLFVSKYSETWETDREDLAYNIAIADVRNLSDEVLSDVGCIAIKNVVGGLIRTF